MTKSGTDGLTPPSSTDAIDLYTWTTPNGRKVSILLEELGLPYDVHPVDIGKDEQFQAVRLSASPERDKFDYRTPRGGAGHCKNEKQPRA